MSEPMSAETGLDLAELQALAAEPLTSEPECNYCGEGPAVCAAADCAVPTARQLAAAAIEEWQAVTAVRPSWPEIDQAQHVFERLIDSGVIRYEPADEGEQHYPGNPQEDAGLLAEIAADSACNSDDCESLLAIAVSLRALSSSGEQRTVQDVVDAAGGYETSRIGTTCNPAVARRTARWLCESGTVIPGPRPRPEPTPLEQLDVALKEWEGNDDWTTDQQIEGANALADAAASVLAEGKQ